jgi:outer membrane lipoprotein-sorting protein
MERLARGFRHLRTGGGALLALFLAASPGAALAELEAPPEGLSARAVAERVEDNMRGETLYAEATMIVVSPRLPTPRRVTFRSWEDRSAKRSFIRILEPAKDAGVGFLKVPPNLWNYIPRVERTVRIPPSMMLQSWMGSDFTNDDLVRESDVIDDYAQRWRGVDPALGTLEETTQRAFVIEYIPHEEAPVVWGRIVTWIDPERFLPLRQEYYDEDEALVRVMQQGDIRSVGDRAYPHRWSMRPVDKEGHETRLEFETLRFDAPIDPSIFTKRHLSRGK